MRIVQTTLITLCVLIISLNGEPSNDFDSSSLVGKTTSTKSQIDLHAKIAVKSWFYYQFVIPTLYHIKVNYFYKRNLLFNRHMVFNEQT